MTTILHVSDLHFGQPCVLSQIEGLLEDVETGNIDVVAIAGDFAQRAKAGEFQAAALFLRRLRKCSRVISVPGNHDVSWWYAPVKIGMNGKVYENYRRYIADDLEPTLTVPDVTLVGINTSHGITPRTLTWNVRDLSILGDVTPAQLDAARIKLAAAPAGNVKIVVMHHNPVHGQLSQRFGLKRAEEVRRTLSGMGADIILNGHDHQEQVYTETFDGRRLVSVTAGTVSNRMRGGRPSVYYHIVVSPTSIEIQARRWSASQQAFVSEERECFDR